ncbi:PEP/pyruvate-binding domain-containing protein [Salinibacterium sp. ZJ450]|uniref:PEP/pyruvate-binding domain-containing protein n=1 Tax=Salinibacterium sp. ZJ450 TaxID=2708338 RepID=UPI00141F9D58|nr:PEP/pyruvate-binding domain-containing protein [Salinibacterium sp. ZJ450]
MTILTDSTAPEASDLSLVGGKAIGLARMTAGGIPVAPWLTVSTRVHRDFLEQTQLNAHIESVVEGIDWHSQDSLAEAEQTIAAVFAETPVPPAIAEDIAAGYRGLAERIGVPELSVAVRSSATAEDTPDSSFAGEYETYVGMVGAEQVIEHVKLCWASGFTAHAMAYAHDRGFSPLAVSMAVVVQKTVKARAAGVMFTLSPATGDRSRIVVEASWGIGLAVVGGEVTPDRYAVDKVSLNILERIPGDKRIEYLDGQRSTPVEESRRAVLCLSDSEVLELARLGKTLEKQQGVPQDIEFAIDRELPDGANIILLQCRPETVWSTRKRAAAAALPLIDQVAASVFGLGKPGSAGRRDLVLGEVGHAR